MLKGKPRWLDVPLYPCKIVICFSYDDAKYMKDPYAEFINGGDGYISDDAGSQMLVVALPANLEEMTPPEAYLVAHEGLHFVNAVMRVIGKPPTHKWGDDEPEAYLIGWFVDEVEKEWRRRAR